MQRRIGNKNIAQQLFAHDRVQINARVAVFRQTHRPFEGDQRADLLFAHPFAGEHHFIDHAHPFFIIDDGGTADEATAAEPFERFAQFRLEHDRQRDDEYRHRLFQQPIHDVQIHPVADDRKRAEHHQPF